MSHDEEFPPSVVPSDPMPDDQKFVQVTALAPRVRWGRATALQLVVGGIAGFVGPIYVFRDGPPGSVTSQLIWVVIYLISGVVVGVFGGGIPLLVAWLSWLIVSRRPRRRLRKEVLAVVCGAIVGALVPSLLPFLIASDDGAPWRTYAESVLILGGIPGLAFALWVAVAWRRPRKAAAPAGP